MTSPASAVVIPAEAGIQREFAPIWPSVWIPDFAGMTADRHFLFRGFGLGLAAVQACERLMISRTRSGSRLS